jgi:hypothetical protein
MTASAWYININIGLTRTHPEEASHGDEMAHSQNPDTQMARTEFKTNSSSFDKENVIRFVSWNDSISSDKFVEQEPTSHRINDNVTHMITSPSSVVTMQNITHNSTTISDNKSMVSVDAVLLNNSDKRVVKRILMMKSSLSKYPPALRSCSDYDDHRCVIEFYEEASDPNKSDAIIVPLFYTPPPKRNNRNQIFVFFNFESPLNIWPRRVDQKDVFNLTISYLDDQDTDIFTPYGQTKRREFVLPQAVPTLEFVLNKSKLIAWMVSHCRSVSVRMPYVEELTKHIPVDIYGGCGKNIYPRGNSSWHQDLSTHYKFYLSFESALCKDYVTEKLLSVLNLPIVPVTLGLVNYSRYLPPHSYIDVRDFESPKHLARHLYHLHEHPSEYMEYFTWKKDYEILQRKYTRQNAYCQLCTILHNTSYVYKTNFDTQAYWDKDKQCVWGETAKKLIHLS